MKRPWSAALALELYSTLHAVTFLSVLRSLPSAGPTVTAPGVLLSANDGRREVFGSLEVRVANIVGLEESVRTYAQRHRWWLMDDVDVGALLVLYSGRLSEFPLETEDQRTVSRLIDAGLDFQAADLVRAVARGAEANGQDSATAAESTGALLSDLSFLSGRPDLAGTAVRIWRASELRSALEGNALDEDRKTRLRVFEAAIGRSLQLPP